MEVRKILDADTWDGFVGRQKFSQFLQSWAWGNFQTALGRTVTRVGLFDNDKIIAAAQIIDMPMPLKMRYCYLPRGPVLLDPANATAYCALLRGILEDRGRQSLPFALRIEPPYEMTDQPPTCLDYGFQKAADLQPATTRVLDLTKTLEELKNELHQKTRYNIGLAERKGVQVHERTSVDGFKTFINLQHATAIRDKIKPFSDIYFAEMYRNLVPAGLLSYAAEYSGATLAANMVINYGDTSTYNHGASSDESRNLMAPHLLQWRIIEEAKKAGHQFYDLRGIAPTDDPEHPWAGITRFKAGFGGRVFRYVGTYDLPLRRTLYYTYRLTQAVIKPLR